ncbi:quinoprotein dehydrogenase-associated SoxYZ-like carrier [Methylopila sp. M107]|uniref:quinoprotein dehydrogenase-associated SoxYZ-like carrier n=1 Tax=Methylopila sp. M107 TaxID=1101190 RepID=UPI000363FC33|nr:quinoprotein dehydrogenase-associated SoxYZ-like carrier [Methylopila sp. M107]
MTGAPAAQSTSGRDPANSPLWPSMVDAYLGVAPYLFDDRVKVELPPVTEDQTRVPVTIDARGLVGAVEEILVIADLNPFPLTVRFTPLKAQPFLSLRMKIEQGTAIHAAARQGGVWRVGGRYLDASGGGCSVKPPGSARADLSNVGQIRARAWAESAGATRLRVRVSHPMDNGMIANVPAYFVETLEIAGADGAMLARLELSEAVAPDPTFTLLTEEAKPSDRLLLRARDNNGGDFRAEVSRPAALRQGRLE